MLCALGDVHAPILHDGATSRLVTVALQVHERWLLLELRLVTFREEGTTCIEMCVNIDLIMSIAMMIA